MPVQETESLLMKELGQEFVKAHEQAKNVKAKTSNRQELPSGLRGIAQLNDIAIKKIKQGKDAGKVMFYADAVIQEPTEFGGRVVKGKYTQISEPLYPTPSRKRKTLKEHLDFMYEHLKMLGVPVEKLKPSEVDLAIKTLKEKKANIFISFRTWKPPVATEGQHAGKESWLMQFWDERVEYKKKDATQTAVRNNLPSEPEPTVSIEEPEPEAVDPFNPENPADVGPDGPEPIDPDMLDQGDIYSLAQRADDSQDLDASNRLMEMAMNAGISKEQATKGTSSWKELADLIANASKPSANGTPSTPKEIAIGIGDQFGFHPVDPATKQPSKAAVIVQVLKIDEDKGTVDLSRVDNPKMKYLNVPANALRELT